MLSKAFGRVGAAVAMLVAGAATVAAQVVAEQDGYELTEQDMTVMLQMTEFLTTKTPDEETAAKLRAEARQEFLDDPAQYREGTEFVNQILAGAAEFQTPFEVGAVRLQLLGVFYGVAQTLPEEEWGTILRHVFAVNPVLAFDEETQMVLTQQDLNSAVRYMMFCEGVPEPTEEQWEEAQPYRVLLADNYLQMAVEEKLFLASASIFWTLVEANWQGLTEEEQANFFSAYQEQTVQNQVAAQPIPQWGGQNLDQDTADFLSRMSLQNHASMLNVIEHIGGTGDYWEIKPYGW